MIEAAAFIGALDAADPSGPNLEYDLEFQALERAQRGTPELRIGDAVKPADEPDWQDVSERAQALLKRTRDLRVVIALTIAQTRLDRFAGLASCLAILRGLLEGQWATVHPQLDADDHDDATARVNALLTLCAADGLLKPVREVPIIESRALGRFALREVRIAAGKMHAPAGVKNPPTQAQLDAALRSADLETVRLTQSQVVAALGHIAAIEALMIEKVAAQAPEFKPLVVDLTEVAKVLAEKTGNGVAPARADGLTTTPPPAVGSAGDAEVDSRDDVVRSIDRICDYYRRCEPSSPVPLLLMRARRLVKKDFLEIIRDLTPSGVAEAETIGGVEKNPD